MVVVVCFWRGGRRMIETETGIVVGLLRVARGGDGVAESAEEKV
jgi:hypothetical protein